MAPSSFSAGIVTSHEWPPGPCAAFWTAHDDRLGADDSPHGMGATEEEATADLHRQLAEMEAAE